MKKFLSVFIALAMVLSLFSGVGVRSAKAADVTPPTISAMTFAGRTGVVTGGNAVALNLSGVTSSELAAGGSITVSEASTLVITSPPIGSSNILIAGPSTNNFTMTQLLGSSSFNASDLNATAALTGGTITVLGTLTDSSNNVTNVTITITVALPIYTMGETIMGTTVGTGVYTVTLVDTVASSVYDTYTFATPAAAGTPFVLRTSSVPLEGIYNIRENGGSPSGADVPIYIKYNISNVTPTAAPAIGATNVYFSGRLFLGNTAGTNVLDTTVVTLGYSATGAAGTFASVASGTTLNGFYNFLGTVAHYGTYAIFVSDGYAPDFPTTAIYASWVVTPGALTVTHVLDPEVIYANQTGYAYIYVTDAAGDPVTTGLTLTQLSGVAGFGGNTMTELGLSGFYEISGTPASAGTANYKISSDTASATFSMNFVPKDAMWNPTIQIVSAGTAIDSIWNFAVSYNPVVANYALKDQLTNLSGPLGDGGFHTLGGTDVQGSAFAAVSLPVQMGGQIGLELNGMFWSTTSATALTAKATEGKKSFKVNPAIVGDIVTVSTDTVNVGDTKDITVTVKQPNSIERNNGKVILSSGVAGMFTVPTGAIYAPDSTFADVTMDASLAYPNNLNIVGGKYVFAGLKFNHQGYVDVKVYDGAGNLSAHLIEYITVNPTMHILTADFAKLVAGQVYPSVKVSGAVTGLAFTPPASIDNGDGSYIFNFSAGIAWCSKGLTIVADSGDDEYKVVIPIVKPTLTITSVHKDGVITQGLYETVTFTLTDPVTGLALTPDSSVLKVQYTKWAVTGRKNLAVSSLWTGTAYDVTAHSPVSVKANVGNPNLDTTVDKPYLAIVATVNGKDITYANALLVSPANITVTPKDLVFYYNQSNMFSVNALDAHKAPIAGVIVSGSSTYLQTVPITVFGGVTGADGTVAFQYTPNYIGQISITAAGLEIDPYIIQIVPAPADTTAPVITVTTGIDGSTVAADTLKLTGSVNEKVSVLYVGFNKVDVLPDGSFMTTVKLVAGANTIDITAYDLAGNKGTKSIKVTYTPAASATVIMLTIGTDIVTVNGKATSIDVAPEIINGRTFVPIRFIAETFGATVDWLAETQGITITLGDSTIGLQIGNATAVINGKIVSLEAAPYIKNSRTMVPLRVISEAFGGDVAWDPALRTITISYMP